MYKVTVNGVTSFSDDTVYIKKVANGCYIPCGQLEATGVCVKIPYELDNEGEKVMTVRDVVYALDGKELEGAEGVAVVEKTNGALELHNAEQVMNILLGGTE